jgi:hypothetical protein
VPASPPRKTIQAAPLGMATRAYCHDGFYLRMGAGLGYGRIEGSGTLLLSSSDPGTDATVTYKGWGPAFELLIGQTVARGFVLGAGVQGQRISKPKVTMDYEFLRFRSDNTFDDVGEGAMSIGLMGAFLDWFPRESKGLHFGSMVGFALLGLKDSHTGIAASLWGGYDFWVSSEWSLGIEARLAASRSKHSVHKYSGTLNDGVIDAALLFTALYN